MQREIGFRVIVQGQRRPLRPVLRDELYRIGREALVNAFRHSGAKSIEVEVEYSARQLRILVRDDGCGIDPQLLHSGRDGHWGLPGMREGLNAWADGSAFGAARRPEQRWRCPCPAISPFEALPTIGEPWGRPQVCAGPETSIASRPAWTPAPGLESCLRLKPFQQMSHFLFLSPQSP
ncbi:MAG TPA: ATP-binding protein, partial [Bryobacteraceae bacterium]|nr:ATP-binding protein [Bryobacteraceae bacterium]